VHKFIVDIG